MIFNLLHLTYEQTYSEDLQPSTDKKPNTFIVGDSLITYEYCKCSELNLKTDWKEDIYRLNNGNVCDDYKNV